MQRPSGYAVGTALMPCLGHWVTYLHRTENLHIDLLLWITDRILSFLPTVLSQMSNKGTVPFQRFFDMAKITLNLFNAKVGNSRIYQTCFGGTRNQIWHIAW